ncbi:hypothetical protein [Sphingopyxis sp. 22461]|uniref:hypothetical protein n=1 Tax=Sphingopyxis sp. 22461 TaxID=3453923 RepID=UPI003F868CE7
MTAIEALLREADALERTSRAMQSWAAHTRFDEDRRTLVALRRELSDHVGQMIRITADLTDMPGFDNGPMIRDRLSALRSRLALHQAEWPTVAVQADTAAAYNVSANDVQQRLEEFMAWLRLLAADHESGRLQRK